MPATSNGETHPYTHESENLTGETLLFDVVAVTA